MLPVRLFLCVELCLGFMLGMVMVMGRGLIGA